MNYGNQFVVGLTAEFSGLKRAVGIYYSWRLLVFMEQEIWVNVKGFEGIYEISNYGFLRVKERIVIKSPRGYSQTFRRKPRIMSTYLSEGYKRLMLSAGSIRKREFIHRLVGFHFCDGFQPGFVINHLDGDKLNNHYKNLEWTTDVKNAKHAREVLNRPGWVGRLVLDTDTGVYYDSAKDAAKAKGYNISPAAIGRSMRGETKRKLSIIFC